MDYSFITEHMQITYSVSTYTHFEIDFKSIVKCCRVFINFYASCGTIVLFYEHKIPLFDFHTKKGLYEVLTDNHVSLEEDGISCLSGHLCSRS